LRASGHTAPYEYPLWRVWQETQIVVDRINATLATEASLTNLAMAATQNKRAASIFNRQIKKLTG
jgi:hypothetical protein